MLLARYKFTVIFFILAAYTAAHLPGQEITALLLTLYFPGLFVVSFLRHEVTVTEIIAFPLLYGMSVWIVFSYVISELNIFYWPLIVGISVVSALYADRTALQIHRTSETSTLFLILVCLFMVSYAYPWSHPQSFIPPGDDMKFHATYIQNIISEHSLPETYGPLYPELDTFSYPVGYHLLISLVTLFTGFTMTSVIISTIFLVSLSCFSFYFLGASLFNEKVGLYSAFSLSFLSLFFHRLLDTATYPNLVGIALQVYALSLFYELYSGKFSVKKGFLCCVVFAASSLTHSYIFIINVFFFIVVTLLHVHHKKMVKLVAVMGSGVLLFMIPYLLRLDFQPLSTVELMRFSAWYQRDALNSLSAFIETISLFSPLLLFLGIAGSFSIQNQPVQRMMAAWYGAILILPALSVVPVYYPGWYTISPDRVFLHVCAPLCIGAGLLVTRIQSLMTREKALFFLMVLALVGVGMHHVNALNSFSPDPAHQVQMNPDDAQVMDYITEHTPPDTIILNTAPTLDSSSWIPVLSKRRVVFPCFSVHRGDGCIQKLTPHEKRMDLKILEHAPDSPEALDMLNHYAIDYVYIPSWTKSSYLHLSPEALEKSPLYQPVIKQGDTHLFRVLHDADPGTTFVELEKRKHLIFKEDEITSLSFPFTFSKDVQGSLFLKITYTDEDIGWVNIGQEETFIESIFTYGSGEKKMFMIPLSHSDPVDLFFHADHDFTVHDMTLSLGIEDATMLSPQVALVGPWMISEAITGVSGELALRIYLFCVHDGTLSLTYYDRGEGDVDINVPGWMGSWDAVAILTREDSRTFTSMVIPVDGYYTVFVVGVYAYEEDIIFTSIEYTENQ